MTEESSESIDAVRALVAERHRFDEWLSALDARREETPEHVYERVHGDYLARRSHVMSALHAHVPGLEELQAELDARAANLATRSQAEEDERAEAMLRHAVGEYDDEKWDDVRKRVESTLATLGAEREALDEQRTDVGSLLENARPEPSAEAEAAEAAEAADALSPDAVTGHEASEKDRTETLADVTLEPPAEDRVSTGANETADWLGVMTPPSTGSQRRAQDDVEQDTKDTKDTQDERDDARPDADQSASRGTSSADERSRADSPSGHDRDTSESTAVEELELTPDEPPMPNIPPFERASMWGARPSSTRDDSSDEAEDVFGDARSARAGSSAGSTRDSAQRESDETSGDTSEDKAAAKSNDFDELAFLRSVIDPKASEPMVPRGAPSNSDAQKTLRCTECGTMNLPTEWYCERCGGELAAF